MPVPPMLLVFVAATLVVLLVPGPSVVYVVTRSVDHGRVGGLLSMLGVEAGALVHVAAAAAGLTALVAASDHALTVLRYAGAAYLVVLGVRQFLARPAGRAPRHVRASRPRLFLDGLVVDLFNPKTALFFAAFLPQFVDPSGYAVPVQVLVLGLCFVGLAVLCDGAYALLAGCLAARLGRSGALRRSVRHVTAGVYVGLGLVAAFA